MDTAKIRLELHPTGGKVFMNGVDISSVTQKVSLVSGAGDLTLVSITMFADVDAEIEVAIDKMKLDRFKPKPSETVEFIDNHARTYKGGAA